MQEAATSRSRTPEPTRLDGEAVRAHLAHRPPFLFVDAAEIDVDGARARARHVFTADQAFFEGHFPGDPIVPGVLLVEFVAQTANLLLSHRAGRAVRGWLVGVDETRFNRPVHPDREVTADVRFARDPADAGDGAAGAGAAGDRPGGGIVAFRGTVTLDGKRCLRAAVNIYRGD
ncbi:MAG: 3-hydroxyacyl-ACP dehydratase FabZ family protein [Azospirillaceae bacterium]